MVFLFGIVFSFKAAQATRIDDLGGNQFLIRAPRRLVPMALLVASGTVFGACPLPVEPGCSPDQHGPDGRPFLSLALLRVHSSVATVYVDPEGRAAFAPASTAWALRTGRVCRTIAADDLLELEAAWERAGPAPRRTRQVRSDRPALLITYTSNAPPREFVVRPDASGARAELEGAVELTLSVLESTFGERFVRELRAAGLETLRPKTR